MAPVLELGPESLFMTALRVLLLMPFPLTDPLAVLHRDRGAAPGVPGQHDAQHRAAGRA